MPGKVVTLLLTVDLQCCRCKEKIQKVLCKLQRCEPIQGIAYDNEKNTVAVSGTFYPECLSKKLRRKACGVITNIAIKPDPPPPEEKPKEEEKKPNEEEKSKEEEKKTDPPPTVVKLECCCRPCSCSQAHQGCHRCCSCGKSVNGPSAPGPYYYPMPFYGGGRGGHCDVVKIVCDEGPAYNGCNIM